MGKFDGTWLEGLDATNEQKAALTTLLVGASRLPVSMQMNADIQRLLDAPFSDSNREARDTLIRTVLLISQEQHAYVSERVTVTAGVVAMTLPIGSTQAVVALRTMVEKMLDPFDQRGFALTGPRRVVVSPVSGSLSGDANSDLLIGSTGIDGLIGNAGNDELVAGGGDDVLLGGDGTDALFGGAGNDFLDGGDRSDYLYGGTGSDIYRFAGSFGSDWVADSDGLGVIQVDGIGDITGAGARKTSEGTWQSADERIYYALVSTGGTISDLIITFSDRPDVITIRNWSPGNLGITLDSAAAPPPQPLPAEQTFAGDIEKQTNEGVYGVHDHGYVSAGPQANAADVLIGTAEDNDMRGLGGNDGLVGADGDDLIDGGAGSDLIFGGTGADTIKGGAGADFIYGSAVGSINLPNRVDFTPPVISGGTEAARGFSWVISRPSTPRVQDQTANMRYAGLVGGNSTPYFYGPDGLVYMESSGNLIEGEAGDDYIAAGSADDVVHGGADNDDIIGLAGDDVLFGDEGDDLVWGDGSSYSGTPEYTAPETHGNDILVGGAGNDVLAGQGGDDEVYGGTDNDMLWGDDMSPEQTPNAIHGDDYLDGGDGADRLSGGGKDDILIGDTGNDTLWGDGSAREGVTGSFHGLDELQGDEGNDELHGGGEDDILEGGADNDRLWGDDDGNDTIAAAVHGMDYLDGGDGADYLEGGAKGDDLFGGSGNDSLYGDGAANRVSAGVRGDDYLDGEEGADLLYGGADKDTLYGGAGNDSLFGDDEALDASQQGDDELDGEEGDDQLVGHGGDDTLYGSEGNDTLMGDAASSSTNAETDGDDALEGGEGNDALFGQGGNDDLNGGEGNDSLSGGSGDDQLTGDAGNDTMFGGAGADMLSAGEGQDYLDGGAGNDELDGGIGDDTLYGAAESDALAGGDGFDYLDGGEGDDALFGDEGNDNLLGANGNDQLNGGEGSDQLLGGEGDDTLTGGAGADYLDGGAGNDTYVVSLADMAVVNGFTDNIAGAEGDNTLVLGVLREQIALRTNGVTGAVYLDVDAEHSIGITNATSGGISTIRFSDGTTIGMDRLMAENYTPQVMGGSSDYNNARLFGGRANDGLWTSGDAAGAVLSGGLGADGITLGSSQGATVLYSRGDGSDTVASVASARTGDNVLRLGAGISVTDLRLHNTMSSLMLYVGSNLADSIYFSGFNALSSDRPPIDRVEFADGTTLSYAQLIALGFDGGSAADYMYGTHGGDRINGGAGNDDIYGYGGADSLTGGSGNDTLRGGNGDDTYVFGRGAGQDLISEHQSDGVDVVAMGEGVAPSDLRLSASGASLLIGITGTTDSVRIENYFSGQSIEAIRFVDGTVWADADIRAHIVNELTEGADAYVGSPGADLLQALGGDDTVHGGEGDDTLDGGSGRDSLVGGLGDDVIDGGAGDDLLRGTQGNDVYLFGNGSGHDTLTDAMGANIIRFRPGVTPADLRITVVDVYPTNSMTISLNSGADTLVLTATSSEDGGMPSRDMLSRMEFSDGTIWLRADWQRCIVESLGTEAGESIIGYQTDDYIRARGGDDSVFGADGNDTLDGGLGYDWLYGGYGNDTLIDGAEVDGQMGDDTYVMAPLEITRILPVSSASTGFDTLLLPSGVSQAQVRLTRGYNTSTGDYDDLVVLVTGLPGSVAVHRFFQTLDAQQAIEAIRFADGSVWTISDIYVRLEGNVGTDNADMLTGFRWDDTLSGGAGYDDIFGGLGNDSLAGGADRDTLDGGAGNDVLDGGQGSDSLEGGTGADTYWFSASGGKDIITESGAPTSETDTVSFDADVTPADVTLQRNGSDLVFIIGSGASQLRVVGQFNPTGDSRIERVTFQDGTVWDAGQIAARTPVALADTVTGTAGNDNYMVDNPLDRIIESANAGTDSVSSTVSYVLPANVENLTLTGLLDSAANGNGLDNVLTGNAGDNAFNELTSRVPMNGFDTLVGGRGDDIYYVNGLTDYTAVDTDDVVVEAAGEGMDIVVTAAFRTTLADNVEVLIDRYSAGTFSSNSTGAVVPRYLGGNSGDNVIAVLGGASAYPTANVASLVDSASTNYDPTNMGSAIRIDGGGGADTMIGSSDNTTYVVDNIGDVIFDTGAYSVDTVESSVSYALGNNLENLVLTGSQAITGNGNDLNNRIDGSTNSASNVLSGGRGNDTYVLGAGDSFVELAGEGSDAVIVTAGAPGSIFRASDFANIEFVTLDFAIPLGSAGGGPTLIGTSGNDVLTNLAAEPVSWDGSSGGRGGLVQAEGGNDTLYGGTGRDTLDGGTGVDEMRGGLGNDLYRVDSIDDRVYEGARPNWWSPDPGSDTIETSVDYTMPENVETLVAVGGLGLRLTVGTGSGRMDGSRNAAADTLVGGASDDGYTVDALDVVIESADGGQQDTSYGSTSYTMADNVEIGRLLDTVAGGITGNASANWLFGNANGNALNGAAGNDTLFGYEGADNLDGGAGDDQLYGGEGNDLLAGGAGNDTYNFGWEDGSDRIDNRDLASAVDRLNLNGPTEADVILSRSGQDLVISVRNSTERLTLAGYYTTTVENGQTYDGMVDFIEFTSTGTVWDRTQIEAAIVGGNRAPVLATPLVDQAVAQGASFSYVVPGAAFTDLDTGDTLTYSATLADGSPLPAWLSFDAATRTFGGTASAADVIGVMVTARDGGDRSVSDVFNLTVSVQDLTLTGTSNADVLVGGTGNDTLFGGDGDDILEGGVGADVIQGGHGVDVLLAGTASANDLEQDVFEFAQGDGADIIRFGALPEGGAQDLIRFDAGVSRSDISVSSVPSSGAPDAPLQLVISYGAGDSITLEAGAEGMISGLAFAGGTSLSMAEVIALAASTPPDPQPAAPELLQPVADATVDEDAALLTISLAAAFSDPQGEALTYAVGTVEGQAIPAWLQFDPASGTLSGVPGNDNVGTLDLIVQATNSSGLSTQDQFSITVANVNDAPQLASQTSGPVIVAEGASATQSVDWFTDVDAGDTLSLSIAAADGSALPAWVQLDAVARTVAATPPLGALSPLTVRVTATDIAGLSVSSDLVIQVQAQASDPLTLNGTSAADTLVGQSGNDTLYGGDGDDTLDGGAGADDLYGGEGNNTYLFGRGDGEDRVRLSAETTGTVNTLQFKANVDPAQVRFSRVFDNDFGTDHGALEVSIEGTADRIKFNGFFSNEGPSNPYNLLQQIRFADGTTWGLGEIVERVFAGTSGNDTLLGLPGADIMGGGAGDDTLRAGAGDDTLDGGAGADDLYAGEGNNIYLFGRGDGEDRVHVEVETLGTVSTLQFKADVSPSQVRLSRAYDTDLGVELGALEVSIEGATDKITFNAFFWSDAPENAYNPLQRIRFADGTTWDLNAILERVFTGTSGNDTLIGLSRADTVAGGAGDDTLLGGAGADTYLFARGDGRDTLQEDDWAEGVLDRVQLAADITQADLNFQRTGNNLEALIGDGSDRVIVQNWYLGDQYHVEEFRFNDGSVLTDTQVQGLVSAMAGFNAPAAATTSFGPSVSRGTPSMNLTANALM